MDDNQQLQTAAPAPTPGGQFGAVKQRISRLLAELSPRQKLWAGIGAVASLAVFAGLLWWAARPEFRVLYAGLDPQDAREISAGLTTAGIPFEVSPDGGTLKVAAENLDKARLATTSKGGPKSGRMGFELFDKPNWIGSEFDERVNYQRALEGELEHTIASMASVRTARVHLVMAHDSLFTDQQREGKASVVLKLRHRSLSDEEADSIRNLVASAVDRMRPESVVLVDADGHSVLGKKSASAEVEAHEQMLAEKLVATLEPVAGAGNVRASVNVDYDTSVSDETDETYDPQSVVTLSMQKSQQTSNPAPAATGVPGTASNAPNSTPPLFPSQAATVQSSSQESGTYGASKKMRRFQQGPGKVRRVTAAALINDRLATTAGSAKGGVKREPRSPDEMKRLAGLAEAAIGFDSARGDQVSVENIAFDEGTPAMPSLGDRLLRGMGQSEPLLKYGTILVAMLALIFFVVRPAAAAMKPVRLATSPALPGGQNEAAVLAAASVPDALEAEVRAEGEKRRAQLLHETVIEGIKADPALSSRLLQSWIHADEGRL